MKVVIVGGVAGGATAAARLRRLDEKAQIIVLERSGFVSYANCGLPYYIGGVISEKSALTLQTPQSFWNRFQIDVRVNNEVLSIHPEEKKVVVQNREDGSTYEESYDKLILSPGAKSIRPNLAGMDSEQIFTLRTVEDTFAIHTFLQQQKPKSAVIIGGGFIGLEMAENLLHTGMDVTVIERINQVMPPLDYDMACEIHPYLKSKGMNLLLGKSVVGFEPLDQQISVKLEAGESINTDMVVMAVGVQPETTLAKQAGLTLGVRDAIVVNQHMQTSDKDIYAVGDAVEINQFITGQKGLTPLAGPANKQGRIAADHICGRESSYCGAQGSSVIKLFDMTAASTGINEKTAQQLKIPYDKIVTLSASHATYYPGANNMVVKVLFSPEDGTILGAQIVGFDGVDKRIDVLATAIRAKMTAADLTELELSYAPPYSSAKDPVNMAGYVIENLLNKTVKQYHWHDVEQLPRDGSVTLLDVRTETEYQNGHIDGTLHIPVDILREHLSELDQSKPVYVNCQSGLRSYIACRILSQNGFDCYNLSGGYRFYASVMKDKSFYQTAVHPCGVKI